MNRKKIMLVMLILCLCAVTVYAQTGSTSDSGGTSGTSGTTGTSGTGGAPGSSTGTAMGTDMSGSSMINSDMSSMKSAGFDQRDRMISMLESRARTSPDMRRKIDDQIKRLRSATADNWESVRDSVLSDQNR